MDGFFTGREFSAVLQNNRLQAVSLFYIYCAVDFCSDSWPKKMTHSIMMMIFLNIESFKWRILKHL